MGSTLTDLQVVCVFDYGLPLFIASTSEYYELELIISWVCQPLIAQKFYGFEICLFNQQ